MPKCIVDGCGKETYSSGDRPAKGQNGELTTTHCRKHYRWLITRGNVEPTKHSQGTLVELFWRRVTKGSENECWEWKGSVTGNGYGRLVEKETRRLKLAHRLSYEINKGEIPKGMMVLHSCDNPPCVNPNHLRLGTGSDNIQEAFDKGRKTNPVAFGENHPKSKLTVDMVRFIRSHPQLGHKEIADMFGLSPNCIRGVRIGRTWQGVE